uniref:Guanine nucleotide-binding protein subunit beta-like protein n=1 Tax=Plectus sambesii TaxID=2011161 RepID=A0A914UI74_9BILA
MLLPDANAVTPSPVLLYLNGDRDRHRYSSVGDDSPSSEDEHAPTAVLPDVAYPIDCAISASGRRVAVLLENSLVVYDKSTMSALFKRAASAGKEDRIAFVDENTVLVGHLDGSFDMATETNTVTIRLNNFGDSKVRAFAVLANQVVVGDWQRRLFLRRLHDDWQTQTALPAGVASSHAIATSATTGLCAAGLNDCSVLLFHVLDGHLLPLSSLRGHGRPVQSVHFADHRLISTADDDTVVVWKISRTLTTTGKLDKFATMTASQRCTDRFIAASLFNDGSFMMRSSSSPARDISPTGVTGATCMAVAAAASLVAFGTERNTVEIYSQSNLQSPTSIVDLTEATSSLPVKLTMTTNGAYIGVVGMDGKLVLVSLRAGESPAISSHSIVNEAIVDVEFDASASRLLIATDRRLIRILSIPSMETVMERRMNGVGAISIIRHFSASQVLFTDGSGVVALVDLSSDGSFVTMANYSTDQIVDLRCSPCLRYVLCLSYDVVAIYDCKDSFKLVASVPCCDGSAVFSSDRCNKVFLIGRQADFRVFDRLKLS